MRHLSAVAEIVEDWEGAIAFYEGLGYEVERLETGYAIAKVAGVLHFGIWERSNAAEQTFGDPSAVDRVPLGFGISLEADDLDTEKSKLGGRAVTDVLTMPWGQKIVRFTSPSGAMCEMSEMPGSRELETDVVARSD